MGLSDMGPSGAYGQNPFNFTKTHQKAAEQIKLGTDTSKKTSMQKVGEYGKEMAGRLEQNKTLMQGRMDKSYDQRQGIIDQLLAGVGGGGGGGGAVGASASAGHAEADTSFKEEIIKEREKFDADIKKREEGFNLWQEEKIGKLDKKAAEIADKQVAESRKLAKWYEGLATDYDSYIKRQQDAIKDVEKEFTQKKAEQQANYGANQTIAQKGMLAAMRGQAMTGAVQSMSLSAAGQQASSDYAMAMERMDSMQLQKEQMAATMSLNATQQEFQAKDLGSQLQTREVDRVNQAWQQEFMNLSSNVQLEQQGRLASWGQAQSGLMQTFQTDMASRVTAGQMNTQVSIANAEMETSASIASAANATSASAANASVSASNAQANYMGVGMALDALGAQEQSTGNRFVMTTAGEQDQMTASTLGDQLNIKDIYQQQSMQYQQQALAASQQGGGQTGMGAGGGLMAGAGLGFMGGGPTGAVIGGGLGLLFGSMGVI